MRGDPQAVGARLLTYAPRRHWASWSEWAERRRRAREQELEVMERLAAEERRARRSGAPGDYLTMLGRRW